MKGSKQAGLRATVFIITLAIFGVLAVTGLSLYRQNQKGRQASRENLSAAQLAAATASQNTYNDIGYASASASWSTYNDTGYASASGISLKYPSDWKINVLKVKTAGNANNPTAALNERGIFLPTAETPQEEWDTCATEVSGDACGAFPGDKTISGSESTINGLAAYSATMQNSNGITYHVTVIRGNKPTSDGIPFVEFTIYSTDPTVLNSFASIIATATFPN